MIRLPATSISLSDNDVSFHLQQIDIYQGLLKQGFKPKDIIRYFAEHRAANQTANHADESGPLDEHIPSCVELATRGQLAQAGLVPISASSCSGDDTENSMTSPNAIVSSIVEIHTSLHEETSSVQESVSPSLPPNLSTFRHAPRQSSLLRFSEAASPQSSSTESTEGKPSELCAPLTHRTYRPRTGTFSQGQSEVDEAELTQRLTRIHIAQAEYFPNKETGLESSSPLRAEAQIFVPMNRVRMHPGPSAIGNILSRASDDILELELSSPALMRSTTSARNINPTGFQTPVQSGMPNSPPSDAMSPQTASSQQSNPSLPTSQFPLTPTPIRRSLRNANTDPRNHQYLDGESFSVYNDSLPGTAQPQTPSDLTRRRLITAREAAYTAPPGMIRLNTASDAHRHQGAWQQIEHGEPSPTARAIGMRERRARELTRSVRAETLRLERTRERTRRRITRGVGGNEEGTDELGSAVDEDRWREELDGDRVGEENFEGDGDLAGTRARGEGMRVVSGNARGRLWE